MTRDVCVWGRNSQREQVGLRLLSLNSLPCSIYLLPKSNTQERRNSLRKTILFPDILNADIIIIIQFIELMEGSGEAVVTTQTLRN